MTNFIAVISGKGGVGKTTTVINLGCALTQFGRDVLLLDANLQTPHLALYLGSPKLPHSLNDVIKGRKHVRDAAFLHPSGIKVVPASLSIDHMKSTKMGNMADILTDLAGTTEIVLLDTAPGFGDEFRLVLTAARKAIVVTNPELPAVADAVKAVQLAEEYGATVLGVVINRVDNTPSELSAKNIQMMINKPILMSIPEDSNVQVALSIQQPLVHSHPESPAAIAFKHLAAALTGQVYKPSLSEEHEQKQASPSSQAAFFSSLLNRLRGDQSAGAQVIQGKAH
ncbi:P-loop NTPase [Candidatus Woesearchaeota archaeon]|nr:P-loop NTPase [Candidatus Woesearchaeota archaeon]